MDTHVIAHRESWEPSRGPTGQGRGYVLATALAAVAIATALLLRPLVRESIFPLLLGAVFLATRWGGQGPGLFALGVTAVGAVGMLLEPGIGTASVLVRVGIFSTIGLAISTLTNRLTRREKQLRALIEHMPAPIAMLDRQMRYLATSRRWREDYRLGDGDLTGRSHYEVFPEIPERWKEIHRKCLAGAVAHADEDRLVRTDGRVDWIRWEVRPWRDPDGEVGGLIIFSEIVTAQREAEEALRLSKSHLETRVRQRTRDLEETNRELDAFASLAAHDLRAPLRAIQVIAGMVRSTACDRLTPEQLEDFSRIEAAGARMDTLIQDLLEYSRLRRHDLPLEKVDLGGAVRQVLENLGPMLRERGAEVEVAGELPPVLGDRAALERVVANLLTNAATYVAKGVRPRIRVSARVRDDGVRLEIEDNGLGVATEDQERIFEPLVRLQRQEDYPGTGLGLAIVRRAVERMRGRAGVESEVSRGSRFWVELLPVLPF